MLESVKEKPQWLLFFNSLMRHDGDNACYQDAAQSRAVLTSAWCRKGIFSSQTPVCRLTGYWEGVRAEGVHPLSLRALSSAESRPFRRSSREKKGSRMSGGTPLPSKDLPCFVR
jgi:hypothetical protein